MKRRRAPIGDPIERTKKAEAFHIDSADGGLFQMQVGNYIFSFGMRQPAGSFAYGHYFSPLPPMYDGDRLIETTDSPDVELAILDKRTGQFATDELLHRAGRAERVGVNSPINYCPREVVEDLLRAALAEAQE